LFVFVAPMLTWLPLIVNENLQLLRCRTAFTKLNESKTKIIVDESAPSPDPQTRADYVRR
jgi:hypothetical protein